MAEINATLAKARCAAPRGEVPDSAYTFEAVPRTHLVRFTRADGEGSTNRRTEMIEVSAHRLKLDMAGMREPRPVKDPEFFIVIDCTDGGHCVGVVERKGRIIKGQRAVRGKSLPLCGVTNAETSRLVGRIRDVAETVRAGKAAQ